MVTVKILGKFEISRDGKTLDDRNFRSNQLVRLLIGDSPNVHLYCC